MSRHNPEEEQHLAAIWFEQALIGRDWRSRVRVEVADGKVAAIGTGVEPRPDCERHALGLPGMPNLHSHAFQRAMAGLAEYRASPADDFWSWREVMYRFANAITPDQLEAIAAFAFVEMLEAGFTRVGEFHYLHHQPDGRPYANPAEMCARIAAAAADSGIALALLPVFYAHGGFGGAPPGPQQRRFVNSLDGFARLLGNAEKAVAALPDAVLGVAPHSLRAVTAEELSSIAALRPDGPVHIHVAEQQKEVADCLAWSGRRPAEWLLDEAAPDARWCLVHATHLSDREVERFAASHAVAGLCPITEANLGDGLFPAARFLAAGGRFGVGSDSNVLISLAEELRLLEYGQRLAERRRCVLASDDEPSVGRNLFLRALDGGGQALGAPASIAVGAPADLIALAPRTSGAIGSDALDQWLFTANVGVHSVWRRGVKLVSEGRHQAREAAERRYRAALDELRAA